MPTEKEAPQKKKEGPGKDEKAPIKRRNSLTDASSTSSSCYSSTSSNISTSSSNADSDESLAFGGERNKGTMTAVNGEDVNNGVITKEEPSSSKKLTDTEKDLSDNKHGSNQSRINQQGRTGSYTVNGKKKNKEKERKMTRKEKRAAEDAAAGGNTVRGVHASSRLSAAQVAASKLLRTEDMFYGSDDDEFSSQMRNDNLKTAIKDNLIPSERPIPGISGPFFAVPENIRREPEQDEVPIYRVKSNFKPVANRRFIDATERCQAAFLQRQNLADYQEAPTLEKLKLKTGHGIAASGINDKIPKMLTMKRESLMPPEFSKMNKSDMVAREGRLDNWRTQFFLGLNREINWLQQDKTAIKNAEIRNILNEIDEVSEMRKAIELRIGIENDEFTRRLLEHVVAGEAAKAWDYIQKYAELLYVFNDEDKTRKFKKVSDASRYDSIIQNISTKLSVLNGDRSFNIFMYLASFSHTDGKLRCFKTKHKCCMLLDTLLGTMSEVARKRCLRARSPHNGFTALHYAALSGMPCQVNALLKHGAFVDARDDKKHTPLYYAIFRPLNLVARQLLWHGADMGSAICHSRTTENFGTVKFMETRLVALENAMKSWVDCLVSECDGDQDIKMNVVSAVTDLHMVRLGESCEDVFCRGEKTIHRTVPLQFTRIAQSLPSETMICLFLLPVQYTRFDTTAPAFTPHIVRCATIRDQHTVLKRIDNSGVPPKDDRPTNIELDLRVRAAVDTIQPLQVLLETPQLTELNFGTTDADQFFRNRASSTSNQHMKLQPLFKDEHNGCFYAYIMPNDVEEFHKIHSAVLKLKINGDDEMKEFANTFYMVQAFTVTEQSLRMYPKMRDTSHKKMD